MMSKIFNEKRYAVLGAIFAMGVLLLPLGARAATSIYFDVENFAVREGDIFLADLEISTPDKPINVVDGTILYDRGALEIKEVSTGGSLFNLWPQLPAFDNNKGTLRFAGGVAEGFRGDKGEILKIIFLAKNEGVARVDFLDGFSAFLHDGRGTQINPGLRPLSLDILGISPGVPPKDEWQDLLAEDNTPPEPFEIVVGQDASIFDNQYFISFFTTDAESGIAYYDVKEGDGTFTRTESPYVLKDQSLQSLVTIKAVDKAGNERAVESMPAMPSVPFEKNVLIWIIAGLVALLSVIVILWRIMARG